MRAFAVMVIVALGLSDLAAAALEVASPDGRLKVSFEVRQFDDTRHCPVYRVTLDGQVIVADSRLGLELESGSLASDLAVTRRKETAADSTWSPVCGERKTIRDHYRQLEVDLKQVAAPGGLTLRLTFRVYDEGVAFAYTLPKQDGLGPFVIKSERSEFRFTGDHAIWATYSAQGFYQEIPLSQMKPKCERPLILRAAADQYLAIAEARLVDYARMKLSPLAGVPHAIVSQLDGPVKGTAPFTAPWRVIMAAPSPGRLLENNFLIQNLNDPCAIADTSWIKPGKVLREVTLTTQGGKACVDFAAKNGLQHIMFDAGWYGHEYDDKADATAVNVDPKRSPGPLDLQDVIRYANEHQVGVILYVNRRALERQLDTLLPLYRQWGVKGIKFGFVQVGAQQWTAWLHEAIRKCATHQLMVDVHDEYRPTGYSRTYPNLMTVEGICGDETTATPQQTLTVLFPRLLAGPADQTVCYYDARVDRVWTHAFQLAKPVCIFGPWHSLFWYDRPGTSPQKVGGAGGAHPVMYNEPELEFFAALPSVWDDTKVLHGAIGQYAAITRRHGDEWFIGCMNAGPPRTLDLRLDFLPPGRRYVAHLYSDDPSVPTRTHVKIDRQPVDSTAILKPQLGQPGGMAVRLVPLAKP